MQQLFYTKDVTQHYAFVNLAVWMLARKITSDHVSNDVSQPFCLTTNKRKEVHIHGNVHTGFWCAYSWSVQGSNKHVSCVSSICSKKNISINKVQSRTQLQAVTCKVSPFAWLLLCENFQHFLIEIQVDQWRNQATRASISRLTINIFANCRVKLCFLSFIINVLNTN